MVDRGEVVWAPDPFKSGGNPRPWLAVSADRLPYSDDESIAVAFTTQSHHPGSFAVPGDAWLRGKPRAESYVLPWSVATLKTDVHVVGVQDVLTDEFTERVTTALVSYVDSSAGDPGR